MGLTLNADEARKADNLSAVIRETGAYVGVITRAEKLLSEKNTEGVGFSFKADDGASAAFLDVYTVKADGEKLRGFSIVQAIMCCLKLRTADEGRIDFERWDYDTRRMMPASATGYPAMMGKRIGVVLQKELQTNDRTGKDVERLNIVTVFDADTRMTATEILDKKLKAERLDGILKFLKPVRDSRKNTGSRPAASAPATAVDDFGDDIPFSRVAA
jgi:hypothetical protein